MPLQISIDTLDSVPESVRENYVQSSDGKYRLDIEGYEEPTALKKALDNERKAARDASKQVSAWASIGKTPEEVQALLVKERQSEEEKATKGGEWDKLKAQMHAEQQKELGKRDERIGALTKSIEKRLVDAGAVEAIASQRGKPRLLLPHVRESVRVVEEDGEFVARVVDSHGNPRVDSKGEFLTIVDLVSEMRQIPDFQGAFDPTDITGSGAGNSAGGGSGKVISEAAFSALSAKDRAAKMKDGYQVK